LEFTNFVQWAFYAVMTGAVTISVSILAKLYTSIEHLNQKIAIIIEKTSWHEKVIEDHDDRLKQLEFNK
jgi:hypothetical protein